VEDDDVIMKPMKQITILLLFISLFVACSPSGEPTASEQPAAPIAEVAVEATAVPSADTPRTEELPAPVMAEPAAEEVAETAVEEPEATSVSPESEPLALPENEETAVEPEAPVEETDSVVISGRIDEGAFFLGDPNAPVTLIDYSDFL
jgi:hypothetical protein